MNVIIRYKLSLASSHCCRHAPNTVAPHHTHTHSLVPHAHSLTHTQHPHTVHTHVRKRAGNIRAPIPLVRASTAHRIIPPAFQRQEFHRTRSLQNCLVASARTLERERARTVIAHTPNTDTVVQRVRVFTYTRIEILYSVCVCALCIYQYTHSRTHRARRMAMEHSIYARLRKYAHTHNLPALRECETLSGLGRNGTTMPTTRSASKFT